MSDPCYTGTGFDATTGNFTVPESGKYAIKITINYNVTGSIGAQIGSTVDPALVLRRTSPSTTDLIIGNFPIFDVIIALLLNLRVILGSGQVILVGDVNLSQNDVIGLFYIADGLNINLNIGGTNQPGIIWSVHSL